MVNDGANAGRTPDDRYQDETVDTILAGILNKDGSFNDEFGELLTKYLGDDAPHVTSLRGIDLSSRIDEPRFRQRVEYEAPDVRRAYDRSIDRRIEEKMPEDARYLYHEAASNAQRPEFTSNGDVRYPSIGVGDSEERVVYDAEWEERARQEAARLQRVREDRMLRGDSTYVRSFVANGRQMRPGRSPLIDPLSADEDFDEPYGYDQRRQDDKRSFFQEGPPANQGRNRAGRQRNTGSASGRTEYRTSRRAAAPQQEEDVFESFSDSYEKAEEARAAWMQPDDRNEAGRRRRNDRRHDRRQQITSTLRDDYDRMSVLREGEGGRPARQPREPESLTQPPHARSKEPKEPEEPPVRTADPEELSRTQQEAQGLRSTVAQIVDKYNKRNEEEAEAHAKALKEEMERQEAARREREAFLQNLPSEIATALDEENDPLNEQENYDDLSGTRPQAVLTQEDSLRAFAAAHAEAVAQFAAEGGAQEEPAQAAPDYSIYLDNLNEPDEQQEEPSGWETPQEQESPAGWETPQEQEEPAGCENPPEQEDPPAEEDLPGQEEPSAAEDLPEQTETFGADESDDDGFLAF